MRTRVAVLGTVLALAVLPALAQNNNRVRVIATVKSIDAHMLVATTKAGQTETFTIAPNILVFADKKVTVKDIKPGDYVASAAVKGTDGKLHSTEVRIFPNAMRGLGEGQRPMAGPGQMMTNATVAQVGSVGTNGTLMVKWPSGTSELMVGPNVPVTAIVPSSKADVKPGDEVQINGTKDAKGVQTAKRIIIH